MVSLVGLELYDTESGNLKSFASVITPSGIKFCVIEK